MGLRKRIAVGAALVATGAMATYAAVRAKAPPTVAAKPLAGVEFSGCAGVRVGPICEITDDTWLTLWLPGVEKLRATTDRGAATLEPPRIIGGGTSQRVRVPHGARWLTVEAGDSPPRAWKLELDSILEPPVLARARRLRIEGKLDEATRELERELTRATPELRGRIHGALARMALARGEIDPAVRDFRKSIAEAEQGGRISDAVADTLACAFTLTTRAHRLTEANELLEATARWLPHDNEGSARVPYYQGLLAIEVGALGRALRYLRESQARAERLGMDRLRRDATEQIALALTDLGRFDEAIALQRSLLKAINDEPQCERPSIHLNLAWMLLRSFEPASLRAAGEHVDRALALLDDKCRDPYRRKNAHLTAAQAALRANDNAKSRRQLMMAQALASDSAPLRLWELDLEGELELAEKRPARAEKIFAREAQFAARLGAKDALWRAQTRQAAALSSRGKSGPAIELLLAAESVLDELLNGVPLSQGRDTFLTERDTSARLLVRLLLEQRQPDRAFAVARRARARMLAGIARREQLARLSSVDRRRWDAAVGRYHAARRLLEGSATDDWSRPKDELEVSRSDRARQLRDVEAALDDVSAVLEPRTARLTALREPASNSEALLGYFPSDRGWVGFFQTRGRLSVRELGPLPKVEDDALARHVLEPFSAEIDAVREIVILSYGRLRRVDFHAALHRGDPLIAHAIVTYGLDLPHVPSARSEGGGNALIVADPRDDLPHSRREGQLVASELDGEVVLAGAAATRAATVEHLARCDLFHYAGHASFAGVSGTESSLLLAGGQSFFVADLLALPRGPRAVVLSACEAARTRWDAAPESMSLAHAFIMRGADIVIAPTRSVRDGLAQSLMRSLYGSRHGSMSDALRRAQLDLHRSNSKADWAAYRALAP